MIPFKVCCIQSADEADMAIAVGAHAVGLVGAMPNGPGPIQDDEIAAIAAHARARAPRVWTVLLTSCTSGAAIADHVAKTGVDTVQIVDAPEPRAYETLRSTHPQLRIMQVVHVEDDRALDVARRAAEGADVLLLDSGKPSAAMRTLGGTGVVHDWTISRRVVEASRIPVFLAGGLSPGNVREAIARVRPYGVDVCSGLRGKGLGCPLDGDRLAAFAAALSTPTPSA